MQTVRDDAWHVPTKLLGMKVLGFESSCDETGVALVGTQANGPPRLLGDALHSQVDMHAAFGGVVPELASRDHIRRVLPLALTLSSVDCAKAGAAINRAAAMPDRLCRNVWRMGTPDGLKRPDRSAQRLGHLGANAVHHCTRLLRPQERREAWAEKASLSGDREV